VKCEYTNPYFNTETEHTIAYLFQLKSEKPKIIVAQSQRPKGKTDCGIFAVDFATVLVVRINMSKLN